MNGQSEQAARVRINSMIESAGFKTVDDGSGGASVSYEGDLRDPDMRKRLAGKKPDYHFYASNSTTPMAFLEAKKYPIRLDDALDQAAAYARVASGVDKPSMIVLASDGIQVRSPNQLPKCARVSAVLPVTLSKFSSYSSQSL